MDKRYYVVFQSTGLDVLGEGFKETYEKLLGSRLIEAHNYLAKLTDEQDIYARLNREFKSTGLDYDKYYNSFIIDGLKDIMAEINRKFDYFGMDFYLDDEVQIRGRVKGIPNVTIGFYLKEA